MCEDHTQLALVTDNPVTSETIIIINRETHLYRYNIEILKTKD